MGKTNFNKNCNNTDSINEKIGTDNDQKQFLNKFSKDKTQINLDDNFKQEMAANVKRINFGQIGIKNKASRNSYFSNNHSCSSLVNDLNDSVNIFKNLSVQQHKKSKTFQTKANKSLTSSCSTLDEKIKI